KTKNKTSEKFTTIYIFCLVIFTLSIVKHLKSIKMTRNDVNGKVVLIAGGAKNLGGLLSRNFAAKGAKVAIHYNSDSTKSDAEKTLADIRNAGGEAFLFQADLTDVK